MGSDLQIAAGNGIMDLKKKETKFSNRLKIIQGVN
jgi:hypothetical protein